MPVDAVSEKPLTAESLDLLPRTVRDKLDRTGIKLHLSQWQAMTLAERARLRDLPCDSPAEVARYAAEVERLVMQVSGAPPDRIRK
jgi:hypothetical protein